MLKIGKAGSGTYGVVYKGETLGNNKRKVAVKKNIVEKSVNFSGSLKELDLLMRLKGHPYIVKLLSVTFGNPFNCPSSPIHKAGSRNYKEDYLYFIFEQGKINGHYLIHGNNLPYSYMKLSMVQMFLAIEYMHGKNVIHRDIKPENLLWFQTEKGTAVKLCDFGLGKVNTPGRPMTPGVVTCWYRAPEICSRDPSYSYPSDIWSAGCIMYEMISKEPFLKSTDDDIEILSKIIGTIPNPTYDDIYKLTKGHKIKLTSDASPRKRLTFKQLINLNNDNIKEFNSCPSNGATYEEYLDLVGKILVLNPKRRLTATQILDHEFFKPYAELIEWCRKRYPNKNEEVVNDLNIICCRERAWACKIAFLLFNGRETLKWYKHDIVFSAIDMFDRYLYYMYNNTTERLLESKYQGKYLTRYKTELHFTVCIYMCIKYYTTLKVPISFEMLATDNYKTMKAMAEAEQFEKKMLKDVLKFRIKRKTIYDEACEQKNAILDEYETRNLLGNYGNVSKHYISVNVKSLYEDITEISENSEKK